MQTITINGNEYEIGVCGCPDNVSLIVGEHCDACGQEVRSETEMDGRVITEIEIKPDHKAVYQVVACRVCGREHRHKLPSKGRQVEVYYWVWNCAKCGMERKRKLRAAKWPAGVRKPIYCSYACAWGGNSRDNVADMVAMRRSGATLQTIGDKYGITRERVRQLLLPFNIPRDYKTNRRKLERQKAAYHAKKSRS